MVRFSGHTRQARVVLDQVPRPRGVPPHQAEQVLHLRRRRRVTARAREDALPEDLGKAAHVLLLELGGPLDELHAVGELGRLGPIGDEDVGRAEADDGVAGLEDIVQHVDRLQHQPLRLAGQPPAVDRLGGGGGVVFVADG